MIGQEHFGLFLKYKNAPSHAFSNNHVSEEDKDLYWELYQWLVQNIADVASSRQGFDTFTSRLSRDGGVQGQRPKDLWASIINEGSEDFGRYPQVFAIANQGGLELGFSLAIHERDYFNEDVKLRARSMMPSLYRRLPDPTALVITSLDQSLANDNWTIGVRHRDGVDLELGSIARLVEYHASGDAGLRGGGTAFKVYSPGEVADPAFDFGFELRRVFLQFEGLMRSLSPRGVDRNVVQATYQLDKAISEVKAFDPQSYDEGKTYALRSLAMRLGQQKFREQLLAAYEGRCAFTGTTETLSLQAAHIAPYNGKRTNHVTNGLLLRADVHNLFDRGLICLDPDTLRIVVSPKVQCETYSILNDKIPHLPNNPRHRPAKSSLLIQKQMFDALHFEET